MVDLWLKAIEDLLLAAPGNADLAAGRLWESTIDRLGCVYPEAARAKIYWDYAEKDDVAPERPLFILAESTVDWQEYDLQDLAAVGAIEVAYAEPVLETAADHKAAKEYFLAWTGQLMRWCAEHCVGNTDGGVTICRIQQVVFPQRTPRAKRDPDQPATDYFWAAWEFAIGERTKYR